MNKYVKYSLIGVGIYIGLAAIGSIGHSNKDAMPITANNVQKYQSEINEAAQNLEPLNDTIDRIIKMEKKPLEDMGYNFDATLISTIKNIKSIQNMNQLTPALITLNSMYNSIYYAIKENPKEAIDKGLVTKETEEKILFYLQYGKFSHDDIPKALKVIDTIEQCQNEHSGICTGRQLYEQALANGDLNPVGGKRTVDLLEMLKQTELSWYLSDLTRNISILRDSNGKLLSSSANILFNTSFKVETSEATMLKQALTNPWWSK